MVDRQPTAKWHLNHSLWPEERFPTYASGPTHVLNRALGRWLGQHADELSLNIWMEDVAHGLWFDQASAAIAKQQHDADGLLACRLFDYRFPGRPEHCCEHR